MGKIVGDFSSTLWIRKTVRILKGKLSYDRNQCMLFAHCSGTVTVAFPVELKKLHDLIKRNYACNYTIHSSFVPKAAQRLI